MNTNKSKSTGVLVVAVLVAIILTMLIQGWSDSDSLIRSSENRQIGYDIVVLNSKEGCPAAYVGTLYWNSASIEFVEIRFNKELRSTLPFTVLYSASTAHKNAYLEGGSKLLLLELEKDGLISIPNYCKPAQ